MSHFPGTAARVAVVSAALLALLALLAAAVSGFAGQAKAPSGAAVAPRTPAAQAPAPRPATAAQPAPASAPAQPQEAPTTAPAEDPLGRETPRGTFVRFVAAAESGALNVAAQYLQWPRRGLGISRSEAARPLPEFLTRARFGELSLWVPVAFTTLLVVLYAAARVLLWLIGLLVRVVGRIRHHEAVPARWRAWFALSAPTAFLLTVGFHRIFAPLVGIPLLYRFLYDRVSIILLLCGIVWWLWRVVDLGAESIRGRLAADHPRAAQSVYSFGRRIAKGAVLGLALLVGLSVMGFDLSATLAGLGIGGVALAFAAQKTLENIFGGVSVLSDRSIVVGDFCKIGPHVGQVEDVGLRTTQLRTLNRTVVHVPNGSLANLDVENFARRDKFFFNPAIGLRYETSIEQLERVLTGIRQMLVTDARVETDTARARFVKLGAYSLDIEVFAYVKAEDYVAYLAIQEELLIRLMAIVKDAGTGFAFPSQTMYVRRGGVGEAASPLDAPQAP